MTQSRFSWLAIMSIERDILPNICQSESTKASLVHINHSVFIYIESKLLIRAVESESWGRSFLGSLESESGKIVPTPTPDAFKLNLFLITPF